MIFVLFVSIAFMIFGVANAGELSWEGGLKVPAPPKKAALPGWVRALKFAKFGGQQNAKALADFDYIGQKI